MSGRLTLFGAGEILSAYFSRSTLPPDSFWLSLILDVTPSPYVSGSELDEPTAPDYARAEIANDLSGWSNEGTINVAANIEQILFSEAIEDWGLIKYWALCNTPTEGMPIMVGQMETPLQISAGDQAAVEAGELDVELGPFFTSWET